MSKEEIAKFADQELDKMKAAREEAIKQGLEMRVRYSAVVELACALVILNPGYSQRRPAVSWIASSRREQIGVAPKDTHG